MDFSAKLWPLLSKVESAQPRWIKALFHHLKVGRARRAVLQQRSALTQDQQALADFGERSSSEFTALAESLGGLDSRLDEVRQQSARLDNILQDHDDDRALFSAFELYKKSVDLAHASIGIALSQEEQMEQMEGRLLHNRDQFAQNSLMFRVLVMNIRAEAARIDPENRATFVSLAAEIESMEQQMTTTVESAFSQIEAIVKEAVLGRVQLQSLQDVIHDRAQRSVKSLRGELEKIKNGLLPCIDSSREISLLLAESRSQTGDLITSLQYQDIVRQQLEHVSQGFDDIAAHLDSAGPSKIDLGYLHQAARVQQKHLAGSRRAIQDASDKIAEGSRALMETGAGLVQRFTEMEQAADSVFRDSRVGELFKQETENLVTVAGQSESTNQRIARLLTRIEESVSVFSTEIARHELDVQLVALNGQIAAARVPGAAALNKLAEHTAQLATDSSHLTQIVRNELSETLKRLKGIREESEEVTKTLGHERADLTKGSVLVSEKLGRLNERIQRSSGEVARNFGSAYQRVADLLPTLQFPTLIRSSFSPAEHRCEELLAATASFAANDLTVEGSERLIAHRNRYTMKEEREAHSSAVQPLSASVASAPPATVPDDPSIELFGSDTDPISSASTARSSESAGAATTEGAPPVKNASHEALGDGVELF